MKSKERAQVLVIVTILLVVLMLLFAVIVDGGHLMIQNHQIGRVADAASKAGMVVVGDRMVTQAVWRQSEAAMRPPCTPDAGYGAPGAACTATPQPQDIPAWLTDEDRAALVSPAMQTPVAAAVLEYAEHNGAAPSSPNMCEVTVTYPFDYQPGDKNLRLRVHLHCHVAILLTGLLGQDQVGISAEGEQSLPQRK